MLGIREKVECRHCTAHSYGFPRQTEISNFHSHCKLVLQRQQSSTCAPFCPGMPGKPALPLVPGTPGRPGVPSRPRLPFVPAGPGLPAPGKPGAPFTPGRPGAPTSHNTCHYSPRYQTHLTLHSNYLEWPK